MLLFLTTTFAFGQVTTSSMSGKVLDDTGEPVPEATITATHTSTGTVYEGETNDKGVFRIANMRAGGPYSVLIEFIGLGEYTDSGINLTLGENYRLNITLGEDNTNNVIEDVVIVGVSKDDIFDKDKTGASTKITSEQIANLPNTGGLTDFVRLTPQANVSDDGAINIAGQNNKYNAIYVDGGINNDVFGLADSGTDGGQTGGNPFAVDELGELTINLAPFDVKQSGFAGGAINAVTRSGTNELHGSAYYFIRNENLAGKTPTYNLNGATREKLAEFDSKKYGFRLNGPIIKDKLFFFANFEKEELDNPSPFNFSNYNGDSTQEELETLRQAMINNHGYEPGTFGSSSTLLDATKFITKIDWNINSKHKLSAKYKYTKFEQLSGARSGSYNINFSNSGREFISTTHFGALELNSNLSNTVSNQLLITGKSVRDDRNPLGSAFPSVQIFDGDGTITMGAEPFSTANALDQDIYTFENNVNIYLGNHNLLIGTHNEYYDISNLFIGRNYGYYRYSDFNATTGALENLNRYRLGFSQLDNGTAGDAIQNARAEFKMLQLGFYAQDEWEVADNFTLTGGVRLDIPMFLDDPYVNNDFNTTTIPLLEAAGYDLKGARSGKFIKDQVLVSPRLGFNWMIKSQYRTQLRGGIGVFTSRIPLAWPGGAFNNTGASIASIDDRSTNVPFETTINNQISNYETAYATANGGNKPTPTLGDVDLYAEDFKLPQFLKFNLGVDQKLPGGFVATADFLYDKTLNDIRLTNLNVGTSPYNITNGGDNRPYQGFQNGNQVVDNYEYIMLADNTHEGYAYTISTGLSKNWKNGLSASLSYSYNDAKRVYDGTSSQNKSQWRGLHTSYTGRNNWNEAQRSAYSAGNKVIATLGYEIDYANHFKTAISFVYNGQQASPYSYVYGGRDGDITGESDYTGVNLLYVPLDANDITLVDITDRDGNVISSATEQSIALDQYISNNSYLSGKRGQYVERNGVRSDWSHIVDMRVLQDFYIKVGEKKHSLQFSLDIFNLTNLINKDWGRIKYTNDVQLLQFKGFEADGTTPTFTFDKDSVENTTQVDDSGLTSSRWQMQLGLRYKF